MKVHLDKIALRDRAVGLGLNLDWSSLRKTINKRIAQELLKNVLSHLCIVRNQMCSKYNVEHTEVIMWRPLCAAVQSSVVFKSTAALMKIFFLFMRLVEHGFALVTPTNVTRSLHNGVYIIAAFRQKRQQKWFDQIQNNIDTSKVFKDGGHTQTWTHSCEVTHRHTHMRRDIRHRPFAI